MTVFECGRPSTPTASWPPDRATGVPVSVVLVCGSSWATSFDVYFGTTNTPLFWGTVSSSSPLPSAVTPSTKYYWRVVARNGSGTSTSPVWSFTTTTQQGYTISALAGTGVAGYSGANGPPGVPSDLAVDRAGNVYIADVGNHRVRLVTQAGAISTVAGSGGSTDSGDGGPATASGLNGPWGIAVDSQGNLYISSDSRIRKVAPNGIISTVAGNDTAGYNGDGNPATNSQLNRPRGLAVDAAGNLYIADYGDNCIRKIAGSTISTVAGQCGSYYYGFAGDGGPATSSLFNGPTGVAVDSTGNLFIADSGNARIRKISNGIVTTVAGGGDPRNGTADLDQPAVGAVLHNPSRLAVDTSGDLFFTDPPLPSGYVPAGRVYKVTNGLLNVVAGDVTGPLTGYRFSPGDGGPATSAPVGIPAGIAVGHDGSIYVVDSYYGSARILNPAGPPSPPSISPGGVLNAASLTAGPVAPGSIATVFGSLGLNSPSQASGVPLPKTLSGFSIQLQSGAVSVPLFYASASQANVQIPWEVLGQSAVPATAVLNGNSGPAQTLKLATFAPAIFATNGQGTGQGAITDSSYRLVDSLNPATQGDVIQIYCTGLGAVTNPPASGSPASGTTLSQTTTNPTVRIGGIEAAVLFSGLVPGTVGEYQVNVQVPAGVPAGPAIPVTISIGGSTSNPATIAVR
jgi:uncharacterized protein (TIGR03437 family)